MEGSKEPSVDFILLELEAIGSVTSLVPVYLLSKVFFLQLKEHHHLYLYFKSPSPHAYPGLLRRVAGDVKLTVITDALLSSSQP
jgi:hypothetical protein